jgi:putative cell wall-binding protein
LSHSVRSIRKRIAAGAALAGLAASGIAVTSTSVSATQNVTLARVAGANRYGTAAGISAAGRTSTPALYTGTRSDVVLASGEGFADGLAAAALAGAAGSPLLLTGKDVLPAETINELGIISGGARRVHIMGGEAAISKAVRDQLTALGYTLVENYNGTNRYDTAAKIGAAVRTLRGGSIGGFGGKATAIIATGTNFADALSASAPSARGGHPILLTTPTALSPETAAAITSLGVTQVIVMGGTSAVSTAVTDALATQLGGAANVIRVAGTDRADTAVQLANIITTSSNGFGFTKAGLVLVNGNNFPDGLAAGPHAAKAGQPLLLTNATDIPAATAKYHTDNNASISSITVIGGTSAISQTVADGAKAAATITTPTATITALQSTLATPTARIVFSEAITAASLTTADFSVLSSNSNGVSAVAVDTDNKGATLTMAAPLLPGTTISLIDGSPSDGLAEVTTLANPAIKVAVASGTVAADTTKPSATIVGTVNAAGTQSALNIVFSEPIDRVTLLNTEVVVSRSGGGAPTVTGLTFSPATGGATSAVAALSGQLVAGDTVSIGAGLFNDLAANTSNAASATVSTDSIRPTLVSVKSVLNNTGTDALSLSGGVLTVAGKALGDTGVSVTVAAAGASATPTVAFDSATGVITVTLGSTGTNNTGAAIAALINASGASAVVSALGSGSTVAVAGNADLTGGTTTSDLTTTFSEAVASSTIRIDLDGNLATTGDQPTITPSGASPINENVASIVRAGVSRVILDAATDSVGNTASPVGVASILVI